MTAPRPSLTEAWRNFVIALAEALHIPQLLDWLAPRVPQWVVDLPWPRVTIFDLLLIAGYLIGLAATIAWLVALFR